MTDIVAGVPSFLFNFVQDAEPTSDLEEGKSWYDTANDEVKVYDGTEWHKTGVVSHDALLDVSTDDHHSPPTSTTDTVETTGRQKSSNNIYKNPDNYILISGFFEEIYFYNTDSYSSTAYVYLGDGTQWSTPSIPATSGQWVSMPDPTTPVMMIYAGSDMEVRGTNMVVTNSHQHTI